ncbi:MAG: ATP-binding cassette domain-containing protein [Bacilli bacterium]
MAFLQVNDLSKSFGTSEVLKDISFTMEKGKTLTIIGNSGSGKTTLLRILCYLENKNNGIISLEEKIINGDKTLYQSDVSENRRNFGLVFQSFNLFPQYTVLENIMLPIKLAIKKEAHDKFLNLPLSKRRKARIAFSKQRLQEEEERIDGLLQRMNLSSKRNSYPLSLSGGEAQRTSIIRAMGLKPKILCFHEPTSALDPKLKSEVAETILKLKEQNTTMIVVTHEMEFAKRISDQVIYMENGRIVEQGDNSIFENPKTNELNNFLSMEVN